MVQYFPVITGSLTVNGNLSVSGNVAVTGSMSGTSSLAANAELLSGTGSVGFTTTGSFTVASSSLSSRTTQIESVYATTGSNSFRATQSITGSLTVTGQIVAQTLNVQQVTSSIVYSSGSNVFGCDLNSRQTFTGSVLMTGSLIVNTTGPELQVNNNGVTIGNLLTDNHSITGSLKITGSNALFNVGCVGIGVSQPSSPLSIGSAFSTTTPLICITGTGTGVYQRVIAAINSGMNTGDDLTIQMGTALNYRNVGQLNYHHEGAGCATNRMSIGLYGVDDVFNVTGNGFVGIGTCTPGFTLDVNGVLNVCTSTGSQVRILNYGGSSSKIRNTQGAFVLESTGDMAFETNGVNERMLITTNGCVVIGTASPNGLLEIQQCRGGEVGFRITNSQGAAGNTSATVAINMTLQNGSGGSSGVVQLIAGKESDHQTAANVDDYFAITTTSNDTTTERMRIASTGVTTFNCQVIVSNNVCINGSGYGLQFTGGNNRIYFGACRAIEGSTSGTTLQIGEGYDKTQIQSSAMMYNGSNGNSPKLYFGAEGNETAGAKAIYLETFWMIIQPHVNEGLRFRAVNASGTQYTIAKMYGTGTFSLDQYSNGTLSVSSGVVVSSSDKCMKIDDGGIDTALPKIMCLNPRYFYWKPETCLNSCDRQLGFYAQDVSEVLGEEVANQSHNCSWGIYDRGIIAMLTKGMQEQQCTICSQASMINTLKTCIGIA